MNNNNRRRIYCPIEVDQRFVEILRQVNIILDDGTYQMVSILDPTSMVIDLDNLIVEHFVFIAESSDDIELIVNEVMQRHAERCLKESGCLFVSMDDENKDRFATALRGYANALITTRHTNGLREMVDMISPTIGVWHAI